MAKKDVKADQTPKGSTANASTKDKNEQGTPGFNLMGFLTESKSELEKVVWPSRQQLISESAAVILMVTLVATTIYFVDNLFEWISQSVFS